MIFVRIIEIINFLCKIGPIPSYLLQILQSLGHAMYLQQAAQQRYHSTQTAPYTSPLLQLSPENTLHHVSSKLLSQTMINHDQTSKIQIFYNEFILSNKV